MATEDNETPNGWPLGLQIVNTRLRVTESVQAAPAEPYSWHIQSSSFSSFTSSNLDTESTASFFQDHSVSLGRLIGIRPGDPGIYLHSRIHFDERERISVTVRSVRSEVTKGRRGDNDISRGICIPLLIGTLEKMSRSKSKSRS